MSDDQETTNTDVVRSFYLACLNDKNWELLDDLVSPDVVIHGPDVKGLTDFRANLNRLHAVFPDQRFSLDDIFARGDRVAVRWTMQGTHSAELAGVPATGRRVVERAIVIYRLAGGKIAEVWPQIDTLGLLRQLGGAPS